MKKTLLWLAAVVLGGTLLSCSSSKDEEMGSEKLLVTMLSEPQPIQLTAAQKVFVNDNNSFTLNFLKTVNEADHSGKSFVYSPLSITYVLGMVNDASTGMTEQELEQTLGFHEGGIQAVNDYCKKLIEGLPLVDKDVQLNIANALFVNKNKVRLKPQYQADMEQYYDAKAEALEFNSQALGKINDWCSDKTNGMIDKILDRIDPRVVTYLLNAIYFKADWTSKFDPDNTKTETFTTENGSTQLPLMQQDVLISYAKTDTYAAIKLPYSNGYWDMTVMLPEEGKTIDDVISQLTTEVMAGSTTKPQFMAYEVDLKLPRFETYSDTDDLQAGLIGLLQKMGIRQAFEPNHAEIPNMCENTNVYIAMMRQKAAIKVNEEGAEAAAVTVAGGYATSVGPVTYPKATFHANRPFVYVIREASSNVILFVGRFTGV